MGGILVIYYVREKKRKIKEGPNGGRPWGPNHAMDLPGHSRRRRGRERKEGVVPQGRTLLGSYAYERHSDKSLTTRAFMTKRIEPYPYCRVKSHCLI
jgi:hypothetical protein